MVSEREEERAAIDWGEDECDRGGVSRNGSLGALGLFARGASCVEEFRRVGASGFDRRGCD